MSAIFMLFEVFPLPGGVALWGSVFCHSEGSEESGSIIGAEMLYLSGVKDLRMSSS